MKFLNNILGAFADGAVLFPLLMTLSYQNGMTLSTLLLSSGLTYFVAGYLFGIPMSVQPLKSIAIAGLAVGASALEIRIAAILLGLIFVTALLFDLERLAKKVPDRLIHGVQAGLGFVLVQQGLRYALPSGLWILLAAVLLVGLILFLSHEYSYPFLGVVASVGFFISLLWLKKGELVVPEAMALTTLPLRPWLVVSLVLPQLALTSANSVLATINVAHKFFGQRAQYVTVRRLVCLVGVGNILSGLIGGLPFCHGSGGVTAHVRGGATTNMSNYIIGGCLVAAAIGVTIFGAAQLAFAPLFLSILLMTVGFMHVGLAKVSWVQGMDTKAELVLMALAAVLTGNMLWVLGVGVAVEVFSRTYFHLFGSRQYDQIQ